MSYKQIFAAIGAVGLSGIASAHQGVPGHIHAELSRGDQAFHAMINWAPVAGLALIVAFGFRHALRRHS